MARLGMLYQITNEELAILKSQPQEEMYEYLLDEIEETHFGTDKAFEMDKSWYELHYCFGQGEWSEENILPYNIVFAGEVLLDFEDDFISLKTPKEIADIVAYLKENNVEEIIKQNFSKIKDEDLRLPKGENTIQYLIDWSKGLLEFYELAMQRNLGVIFSVDL